MASYVDALYSEFQTWKELRDYYQSQGNATLKAQYQALMDQQIAKLKEASVGVETSADVDKLLQDFETANQQAIAANEQRYGQLLTDAQGQSPTIFNQQTGQWEANPNYQAPLSYQERIDALTGAGGAYDQTQQRYDTTGNAQKLALDNAIYGVPGGYEGLVGRATRLGGDANKVAADARADALVSTGKFGTRKTNLSTALGGPDGVMSQFSGAYQNPNGILNAYGDRASTLGSAIGGIGQNGQPGTGVLGNLATALGGISTAYGQRDTDLTELLSSLGSQQREDLNQQYDAFRQNQMSQLGNRGLGNSTVMSSVAGGVEAQRAQDMRRLEDQLTRENLDYRTRWSEDTLSARDREAMANAQYGLQGVDRLAQYGLDTLGAREGFANTNLQAGFNQAQMNAAAEADQANALMQAAQLNNQAGQQAVQTNVGLTGDQYAAMQRAAENNANLGLQGAAWSGQTAAARNQLTGEPLRAIEARTDLAPSLADVANLTLQLGRGQAAPGILSQFGTLTKYYQPNATITHTT